ncbi:MAG: efflux RND transporter periplasmic adaptor subunit, partial [Bacteroidia bacterium]|nr:efflux RND transporter periplasmic adaptor subunit [Bacteroidia bacterium]
LITMQEAFLIHNSELSYLEEESKRLHNLYEENIVTKKEVLSADAALRTAKAKFQAVKKKLTLYGINTNNISSENFVTRLPILAPQSGNLKEINVVRGDYLDQSTPAMLIEATTNLFAEFNVFEKDVPFIKKGQKIIFTSQTNPETMYHSEITLINQSLGENGMISILSEVTDKQTTDLLPGMKIKGNIKIESMISHALPEDAFVKIGDKSFILKLISENEENYSFEKIMLPTGELQDNYLQITKFEENSNEKYLVKGAYFLIN